MAPASTPAGDSGAPLATKLGITAAMRVALLHAPDGSEADLLGPLPEGVVVQHGLRRSDQVDLVLGFVTERDHLARNIGWITDTLLPAGAFWVAWPKRASGMATDITEDVVRKVALPLRWIDTEVCEIDATWSAVGLLRAELPPATGPEPGARE